MTIEVEAQGPVTTIRLARPRKRNAFTGEMLTAIESALFDAEQREDCRVVVLAGDGPTFSAGADLRWMAEQAAQGRQGNLTSARRMGRIFHQLHDCKRPTIARVHGAALGGGVGLATACDYVVACKDASFTLSEARLGLVPAVISPFIVGRIGPSRARGLFMAARRVMADEAARMGMVDVLVESADDLDDALGELLTQLFRAGPEAQAACKRLVAGVQYRDPADVLDFTAAMIADARATDEATEGITAFLSKRAASWVPVIADGREEGAQ